MSERKTFFANILIPVPVHEVFTYRIPFEMNEHVLFGQRVIVPFGKSKLYTSISYKTHNYKQSDFELKSIIQIVDDFPIVNNFQLKFWDWVSRYYFTSIGEVMRASIPSNLVLQSETVLTLNSEKLIN